MNEIVKEVTEWETDYSVPNHTYLLDKSGRILAYAIHGGSKVEILKTPLKLDKKYRKFQKTNHAQLAKLVFKNDTIKLPKREGVRTFKIKSKDKEYTVELYRGQYSCTCVGFGYRRKCKHVAAVAEKQQSENNH